MSNVKPTPEEVTEARDRLRTLLPVGSEITVIIHKVNPTGDRRTMSVLAVRERAAYEITNTRTGSHAIERITVPVAVALGMKRDKEGHVIMHGGGMDMAAYLGIKLGHALYSDDYALNVRAMY